MASSHDCIVRELRYSRSHGLRRDVNEKFETIVMPVPRPLGFEIPEMGWKAVVNAWLYSTSLRRG
jgi:hypothetical protein